MRILTVGNMYPPHHLGGYELMWRSTVGRLRAGGHDVRVLTTDWRADFVDPSAPEDDDVHRDLGWYWSEHEFPRRSLRDRVALERRNRDVLARHLDEHRPDVLNWWAMGGMSLSLVEQGRRAGLPAAGVIVDDWLLYGPLVDQWSRLARGRRRALAPLAERAAGVPARLELERAAVWLFASETVRGRARDAGFDPPAARVAHPGIDHELFRPPAGDRPPWRWRLLYCGRIDERKGVDTAIEALAQLPAEASLTVLGGGDEAHLAELRELARRLGLEDRVTFARRPRAELPAAYADADATLFPVRWVEPFGLVPLESMAVGTPVVASGMGGSSEYLRDGDNCLLFDVEAGAEALVATLRRLADDPGLRARVSAGGLETAPRFREQDFDAAVERALADALAGAFADGRDVR